MRSANRKLCHLSAPFYNKKQKQTIMINLYELTRGKKSAFMVLFIGVILAIAPVWLTAQNVVPFEPRERFNIRGDFTMIGNTNLRFQNEFLNYGTQLNNNTNMVYVNTDITGGTYNSSIAELNLRSCSQIQYAGLYWTGRELPNDYTQTITYPVSYDTIVFDGATMYINPNVVNQPFVYNYTSWEITAYMRDGWHNYEFRAPGEPLHLIRLGSDPSIEYYIDGIDQNLEEGPDWRVTSTSNPKQVTMNTDFIITARNNPSIKIDYLQRANNNSESNGNVDHAQAFICIQMTGTVYEVKETVTETVTFHKNRVRLKHETAAGYTTITADDVNLSKNILYPPSNQYAGIYAAYADVTDYVRMYGVGNYTVADIALREGQDPTGFSGGWGMVVVYTNDEIARQNIVVLDGYTWATNPGVHNLRIDGIQAPTDTIIAAKLGFMATEGGISGQGATGDYFGMYERENTSTLYGNFDRTGSLVTGVNNFFNSSITTGNNYRNPDYRNTAGIDIGWITVPNGEENRFINNGQQFATLRYGTTGDQYSIFSIVMSIMGAAPWPEIDCKVPAINGVAVVTPDSVAPGQTIKYTFDVRNKGPEPIDSLIMTVPIPYLTTFLSDSMTVWYNPDYPLANSRISFYPAEGASGTLVWYLGDELPAMGANKDTIIATLTIELKVTEDCNLLAVSTGCEQSIILDGNVKGKGSVSGVRVADDALIFGFQGGDCADFINYEPYGIAVVEIPIECNEITARRIRICNPGERVDYATVASYFPSGVEFYSKINEKTGLPLDGADRYTSVTGFPVTDDTLYAVTPVYYENICFWKFNIIGLIKPEITLNFDGDTTICQGTPIDLSGLVRSEYNVVGETVTVRFYSDSTTGNEISNVVYPDTNRNYYAQASVNGSQCFGAILEIPIEVLPVVVVHSELAQVICSTESFAVNPADSLSNTVPENTVYRWEMPIAYLRGVATTDNITGLLAGSGATITGILTNSNDTAVVVVYTITPITTTNDQVCEGETFTVTITVKPLPAAPTVAPLSVCYNESINLMSALTGYTLPEGGSYRFYTADGDVVANTLLTNVLVDATYYVVTVVDGCESQPRQAIAVTVLPLPKTPVIILPNVRTVCSGAAIEFFATPNSSDTIINWYDGLGNLLVNPNLESSQLQTS